MKNALHVLFASLTGLAAFTALCAATPLVRADSSNPMIEVGSGAQAVRGEGMRGLIRVSYTGSRDQNNRGPECGLYTTKCGDYYFAVEGTIGLGLSGQSPIASADLKFTYLDSTDAEVEARLLPIRLSRDIAVGKEGKLQIDFLSLTASFGAGEARTRYEKPSSQFIDTFVSVTLTALGAQALLATPEGASAMAYAGVDVGTIAVAGGLVQRWTKDFSTRITVGGQADLGVVVNGHGVKVSSERSAFARLSAILDQKRFAIEAFLQGDAGQMQVGTEVRDYVSIQAGALTRF